MKSSPGQFDSLRRLTTAANGLMPLEVYEAIFEVGAATMPRNAVEIGTAHGAATIALGLGALTRGGEFTIWTVDKLGGRFSSRSAYGSVETNRAIVEENFARAGLSDKVRLFVGDPDDFAAQPNLPERIDLLMLDADGRIDRDLLNLYPRMPVGAPVIIDDADDGIGLGRNHHGTPFIDNKHRTAHLLLDGFCAAGFLTLERRVAKTAFCRRGDKPYDRETFTRIALAAYRQLVTSEVDDDSWRELARWSADRATVREGLRIRELLPTAVVSLMKRARGLLRRGRGSVSA